MLKPRWILFASAFLVGCSDTTNGTRTADSEVDPPRLILNPEDASLDEPDVRLITQLDAPAIDAQVPDATFLCHNNASEICDLGEEFMNVKGI